MTRDLDEFYAAELAPDLYRCDEVDDDPIDPDFDPAVVGFQLFTPAELMAEVVRRGYCAITLLPRSVVQLLKMANASDQ